MRVAVCDDDRRFCYKMKDILEQYEEIRGIHMETDLFFDGNELCGRLETGQRYHLIFLDVLMKKLNGVETGKFIRRVIDDYDTRIIYVSCDKEYAIELIQNQPTNFLKKPGGARQIFQNLDAIQRRDRKEQNQFFYRQGKLVHEIPYSEIVYYQSMGRKIQIHTPKQVYEYNGKLSQLLNSTDKELDPDLSEYAELMKKFLGTLYSQACDTAGFVYQHYCVEGKSLEERRRIQAMT